MSDLRKAAEIALEALEWNYGTDLENIENCTAWLDKMNATIPALRQALAQPKQKQKTPLKVLNLTVFVENRLLNGRVYDVETLQAMTNRDILAIPDIGKKALGEVLEALNVYASDMSQERVDETAKHEHEPVAFVTIEPALDGDWRKCPSIKWVDKPIAGPLYTAPPISDYHEGWEEGFKAAKREWVGLTDDDVHDAFNYVEMVKLLDFDRDRPEWCEAFASACEATLRHKNGGNK
jgi:hypothetical protein